MSNINLIDDFDLKKGWVSVLFAMFIAVVVNLISQYLIVRLMQKSEEDNTRKIIDALKGKYV